MGFLVAVACGDDDTGVPELCYQIWIVWQESGEPVAFAVLTSLAELARELLSTNNDPGDLAFVDLF